MEMRIFIGVTRRTATLAQASGRSQEMEAEPVVVSCQIVLRTTQMNTEDSIAPAPSMEVSLTHGPQATQVHAPTSRNYLNESLRSAELIVLVVSTHRPSARKRGGQRDGPCIHRPVHGSEAHVGGKRDPAPPLRRARLQEDRRRHDAAEARVRRLVPEVVDVHRQVQPVARRRLRRRRVHREAGRRAHDLHAAAGGHRLLAQRERVAEVRRRIPRRRASARSCGRRRRGDR